LSEEAKRILKQAPERRTEEHIKIARESIVETVPEFEDFPIEVQDKILKRCLVQEFESNRVIIRQNHKADYFYFIVSGIGYLFVPLFIFLFEMLTSALFMSSICLSLHDKFSNRRSPKQNSSLFVKRAIIWCKLTAIFYVNIKQLILKIFLN
jgi:hypothetical protein